MDHKFIPAYQLSKQKQRKILKEYYNLNDIKKWSKHKQKTAVNLILSDIKNKDGNSECFNKEKFENTNKKNNE
jgi:hypothetical protein